jgi:hypothetical protein
MNKEQIYDDQISPLMAQIIAICQTNKIAFLSSFSIPTEDDPELRCTSVMLEKEFEPPEEFLKAWREIRPASRSTMMLCTESGDGTTTLTAIVG